MTSRQRKFSSIFRSDRLRAVARKRRDAESPARIKKRRQLLETLEPRQLLAGPQLIGIQPNEGDLILNGSVLQVAPRALTFKFDQNQEIDPSTFDGIRVSRAGDDGLLGTADDIRLNAGLVTLGDNAPNEVVVRFSDALPDDQYNVEVFGFDDGGLGIVGLRNVAGELLQPRTAGQRIESTTFRLKLGAQIEAVVPQPVVRLADGSLVQNRNEIVVYFNEDPLFVENDASGNPTLRSAENPRFYQLFLTQDTVRTTDDALYHPDQVVYDATTHTARLIFSGDINELGPDDDGNSGVPVEGGTFRLRIGTAVDDRIDVILPPLQMPVAPSASTSFGIDGLKVQFVAKATGENASGLRVQFRSTGSGGLTVQSDGNGLINYNFGGTAPTVANLRSVTQSTAIVQDLIDVNWIFNGQPDSTAGGNIQVPSRAIGSETLVLSAVGDTLSTALDVGVFGSSDGLTSLIFSESIDPVPVSVAPFGGSDVDLYRFEVDLGDADQLGKLTAETFAERLPDSSSLDTALTLFQEVKASAETDFGAGSTLAVRFDSLDNGRRGNNTRIDFFRSDRAAGDNAIRVTQPLDSAGQPIANGILVNLPRNVAVSAGQVIDAINNHPFASGLLRATIVRGSATTTVGGPDGNLPAVLLGGGGVQRLSRNDDYFSEDSRLITNLGAGVYYIGVAASGNETYDPTTTNSGFGGVTQGRYDLHLKFEPQVDEVDVLRDLDSDRANVPGTPLDGDADGVPGGVHHFWFQTRSLNRQINFTSNGAGVTVGQTVTIIGGSGVTRTYEFLLSGQSPSFGNIPVIFSNGTGSAATSAILIARELRNAINSRSSQTGVQATVTGSVLELTGDRSIELSNDFRGGDLIGRNIFVDKTASPLADGSLNRPFNNIANANVANAFDAAMPGDIVRIIGNGGNDRNLATEADNFSYQIGVAATGGGVLSDGRNLEVPLGVTTMIDAGAILKFRTSRIGVGSSSVLDDRSGGALQVLGTPRLVQLSAEGDPITTTLINDQDAFAPLYSDGSVILTSIKDRGADVAAAGISTPAAPGDWGGLVFRRDIDRAEGRFDLEDEGIFLQTVNHAQIRYGGGSNVLIDSVQQLVNPVQIFELRPSVTFNEISFSADAALSASPDSFEETSYQAPRFQQGGSFTADYSRIGPEIHDNRLIDNSINGLFIRVSTTPDSPPKSLTTSARFDDSDVVHYFSENILIQGTPGGSIQDGIRPDLLSTSFTSLAGGGLQVGTYDYRMTFVDESGFESLPSDASAPVTVAANSSVQLFNLPQVPDGSDYISRRLYRLDPGSGNYQLIALLDASGGNYLDDGSVSQGILDLGRAGIRGDLDASLVIDPAMVLKFQGTRIQLGLGTQLLAEGTAAQPIIFTSFADDRFGSGGTFDTNNDSDSVAPSPGDWSGLYAGPNATVSLDHVTVAYGGGISLLAGGQGRGFAALELQDAEGRVTNSKFEFNADAQAGSGPSDRFGLGSVTPATIFVRDTQPIIVGNVFSGNQGSIIDIDVNSMVADRRIDIGRQTGDLDRFAKLDDNFGPLIRLNRYAERTATDVGTQISGLEIRGGTLTGHRIWDDTDIVHLLFNSVNVGNLIADGGLKLLSRSDESLVVKFTGGGSPYDDYFGTGLTASGSLTNDPNRVGGSLQIVGSPGFPVVLTSFQDDSVGAGLTPTGTAFTDNNGNGPSRGTPNDWRGILLDQYSNDRNVDFILEQTIGNEAAPGLNGTVTNAQVLGALATSTLTGNEQFRLGFEVEGRLSADNDVDTYSFTAEAGTQIWIDVDYTSLTLDSIVEILDSNGNVLARSDNSFAEFAGTPLQDVDPTLNAGSLKLGALTAGDLGANGLYNDYGSTNVRDAGMRLFLPGNPGTRSVYFFRIRSAALNQDDRTGGITNGSYRFQVRLREEQEFPGSVIRYTDIRYANVGIYARGQGANSPFLGDAQEDENGNNATHPNADNNNLVYDPLNPGNRAQYIGNLLESRNMSFSIGGALLSSTDVDFYQIDVSASNGLLQASTVFDVDYADGFTGRPDTSLVVFYDRDGESGALPPELVLIANDSNVIDDQGKPVSSANIDLLTRGSGGTGDPFIGPVSLSQGTYFVGVVANGAIATALNNLNTRREPIESILRIFEDHVEQIGGSTALPPREADFIDRTALNPGWSVTTNRALNIGHNRTDTFNSSRNQFSAPSIQTETDANNNSFAGAQNLDLAQPIWSLGADGDIGDRFTNTSTTIPHTTVRGSMRNDFVDVYQVVVDAPGSFAIADIDYGFDPDLPFDHPTNVDLQLILFDSTFTEIDSSSFSLVSDGAGGSKGRPSLDPLFPDTTVDPYLEGFLPAGTYYLAVARESVFYNSFTNTFQNFGDSPDRGDYELHVSIANHVNGASDANNQSYFFDRSQPTGVLESNPFDLSGYSAADLPQFYFNYFYNPGGTADTVAIEATSASTTGFVPLSDVSLAPATFETANQWRQGIASLGAFAGHEDVVIRFTYQTAGGSPLAEGLYLDDFVVGFAERGEMITGAGFIDLDIAGGNTTAGQYQLEIRPGTDHGTTRQTGIEAIKLDLTETFDTNDRQTSLAASIVAPHIDQIADGDTFRLGDGVRSIRFEFDFSPSPTITSGNIRVPVSAGFSQSQVADAIRTAINQPAVQSTIAIQASDASGSPTGGSASNVVALAGLLIGDFLMLDDPGDLPPSGQPLNPGSGFRLPVVFSEGLGDVNVERAQSQLILDSNVISDSYAIGIWSRFGERVQDPQDDIIFDNGFILPVTEPPNRDDEDYIANVDFANFFPLNRNLFSVDHATPHLGASTPGAVRNLPTVNNSLVGGITPGVVIVNNTIDQAGYAGIKTDGQTRPFLIDSPFTDFYRREDDPDDAENVYLATFIPDGLTMAIHAAGERVIFEFEDISGGPTGEGGSGVTGGDGWQDGHVPIYYRQSDSPYTITGYGITDTDRSSPSSRTEVMWSIYQSILGSPLVTNGLVELVEPSIGPSRHYADFDPFTLLGERTEVAAVYIEGASAVSFSGQFQKINAGHGFDEIRDDDRGVHVQAAVHEGPQTLARVINNTIYGRDGLASSYSEPGTLEPNDLLSNAVDTRQGSDAGPIYQSFAEIGDGINGAADVDFYEVELGLGDRLTIDIDTLFGGPDTHVRLFNSNGVEVASNALGIAPGYLNGILTNPLDPEVPLPDPDDPATLSTTDPFMDFTAATAGTYYIAVSSQGNESYDPLTLSGRVEGSGGTGPYGISVNVFAPRTFTFNFDAGGQTTDFSALLGTTITVTHVRDIDGTPDDPSDNRNTTVYEFVSDDGADPPEQPLDPANVPIPLQNVTDSRVPDVLRTISATLTNPDLGLETIRAAALGGELGNGPGIITANYRNRDMQGFGHDRTPEVGSPIRATTETFIFVVGIADFTISEEGAAAGLNIGPYVGSNAQGGIPEAGLVTTNGTSATVMNNVFANLDQSLVRDHVDFTIYGDGLPHPKQSLVIVTGNLSQDDTNDSIVDDDFNRNLNPTQTLFANADGNNFLPDEFSPAIDGAINSVIDRIAIRNLRASIGLPDSNILAPDRDVNGVKRADKPGIANPGGIGGFVFKDRGSNELADFVGPVAIAITPLDNDSLGVDMDTTTGFIQLRSGTLDEFRIQLRDTGDASDPFAGLGIDDNTIVVAAIPGLRPSGANITLFEDEVLLAEGIDYAFSYDQTQNVITLTPLAGTWKSQRAYRIELNNRSRTVLTAPSANEVADGNQLSITDDNGGTIVFEFESGYSLLVPEPITLVVPQVGTNAGGLRDGGVFTINDGSNDSIVFEFNLAGDAKLPNSVEVLLPSRPTPSSPAELKIFLEEIAENIAAAIRTQVNEEGTGPLNFTPDDIRIVGSPTDDPTALMNQVIIGAEPGAFVNTTLSALQQLPRTLALQVPPSGVATNGIVDGDTFVIGTGSSFVTFEFDTNGTLANANNRRIPLAPGAPANVVALAIQSAVSTLGVGSSPTIGDDGRTVYLNLPPNGSASVPSGRLAVVGLSRTLADGDLIVITGTDGDDVTFEIDTDGEVTELSSVAISVARNETAFEIASKIADAIESQIIPGLNPSDLNVVPGGLVSIGGQRELLLSVDGDSLEVVGSPGVATSSTIQIQGPVILTFSPLGGGVIQDGSVLVLKDNNDNDVVFEFNERGTAQIVPGAINVPYDNNDLDSELAISLVAAVNASTAGITASISGVGQVSFGQIDPQRVSVADYPNPNDPLITYPGVLANVRQGLVMDGEVLTIRQGTVEVNYEFESSDNGGGVGLGNVPVVFQTGSTIADVGASLAAAINNNSGGLDISASVDADGLVSLDDRPGTIIDASQAPTLSIGGVPGGATPILISPGFSSVEVKQALINAINSVNRPGATAVTTLSAENRGGSTLFVSGGVLFNGPVTSFALPAIADLAGNPLEANRPDLSTQFTILMPNVGLDFGDAPDPVAQVAGRYPTRIENDGARHVVDDQLFLGHSSDPNSDGIPSIGADGDDLSLQVTASGDLFAITFVGGNAQIVVQETNALLRDGDTITIDTGVSTATLEFDIDGIFDEDNFAIQPADASSLISIATAIGEAISESPLRLAGFTVAGDTVTVIGDDEDGVVFTSDSNPLGILNRSIALPIEVTVTGAGIVEAWIDFNGDGDWSDPGEQIIPMDPSLALSDRRDQLCPANQTGVVSNIFSDSGEPTTRTFCIVVPPSTATPVQPLTAYARFRVSREGGLTPTGLALSGEVEDYALTLLPGTPPTVSPSQAERSFSVDEEQSLQVLDATGTLTPLSSGDDGLLVGIIDINGDAIEILSEDVGNRELRTPSGEKAGDLNLENDGTFSFVPVDDFNGTVEFKVRVTDVKPLAPATELVSPTPITVSITVNPVNDRPFATANQMTITRVVPEDQAQTFTTDELIGNMFAAGPANEADQPLIIQSAGSNLGPFTTTLGGTLAIATDGLSIVYTPPADYNGAAPDSFTYVVADVPVPGQISLAANTVGSVTMTFQSVNDPPRTTPDTYMVDEGAILNIPINGTPSNPGILDNDTAGPADEVGPPQNQTIELAAGQFPKMTDNNGTVALSGDGLRLIYTPAPFFSGIDRFEYTVVDRVGGLIDQSATEEVLINVGGVNDSPMFVGVQGNPGQTTITRDEAKVNPDSTIYQLGTWFQDPDGDNLTFTVSSNNPLVAIPTVVGNQLTIVYPAYGFGTATLTVTASDGIAAPTTQLVQVIVNNTPDAPQKIGSLNPQNATEDSIIAANLANVFSDPDREPLTYAVARIGSVLNPTAAQIAAHPLVNSINFPGGQMVIQLKPNQFGSVDIEISAADGVSQPVSDSFTLTVTPVPDAPIARPDGYNVPIGSALQILNANSGLLRNDEDADGDFIKIDLGSATTTNRGTLQLNDDGTFVYTNTSGSPGQTDSFTYHVIDTTGRISNTVSVTLTLNESQYQNPLTDLNEDVNADGLITAIDALRIINFLGRRSVAQVPVVDIGAPPPDFFDVNGDGRVSALDALNVVNRLRAINNRGAGEQMVANSVSGPAATAVTSSFATGSPFGLPTRNIQPIAAEPIVAETGENSFDFTDQVMSVGMEIFPVAVETAVESAWLTGLAGDRWADPTAGDTDAALADVLDSFDDPWRIGLD